MLLHVSALFAPSKFSTIHVIQKAKGYREECQPETYEIGGDSLDSDLDWFPERRCKNESAPGEVETFLHSTKSSKKTADNQRLKLETLQTNSRRGRMVRGTEAAI